MSDEMTVVEIDGVPFKCEAPIAALLQAVSEERDELKARFGIATYYVDWSGFSPSFPPENVVEWAIMPSGRIVVMTQDESLWFEANGTNDKGTSLRKIVYS